MRTYLPAVHTTGAVTCNRTDSPRYVAVWSPLRGCVVVLLPVTGFALD